MQRTIEYTTGTIEADSTSSTALKPAIVDTVLIKVASRCNIDCTYCYVYHLGDENWLNLPKIIADDTIYAVASSLGELSQSQTRAFSIVLHGGEPLLLGTKKLDFVLEKLRASVPSSYPIGIQTNGLLISDSVLDICVRHNATVAVSLDGPADINDAHRVDHRARGTFERVMAGIALLNQRTERKKLYAGLLAVINPTSNPETIYEFFKNINAPSVDFLYRDGNHSRLPEGKRSIDSIEYGTWMARLLEVYLSDSDPLEIRVLDDMLRILFGGSSTKEGLGTDNYGIVIIDTDGSFTKNDTLKSAYPGADQFINSWDIHDNNLAELLQSAEFAQYIESQLPQSVQCRRCPILSVCGGGMALHRWHDETRFDNPSVYCADQKHLVERMRSLLGSYNVGR